jgi:hypothetical protein
VDLPLIAPKPSRKIRILWRQFHQRMQMIAEEHHRPQIERPLGPGVGDRGVHLFH